MCGIVGAAALGKASKKQEEMILESMIFLTTELLQLTQARGSDATGISALFSDGNYYGLKMGVPSTEFISRFGGTKTDYEGILKLCRKNEHPVKALLGHCRKISVGTATDNANNHPVKVGDVVGVHNGTVTNHDVIFDKLKCKRDGDVDTEAIMRLLHFYSEKGTQPFTVDMLKEVCRRLEGTYSVIAFNGNSPNQLVTFRDSKPAELLLIRPLNIILIASEKDYLKTALFRYNKQAKLYMPISEGAKFPLITSSDVDFLTMPDDTAAIFNLAEGVKKDVEIKDIFEKVKVPRQDRLWRKGTVTYSPSQHQRGLTAAAKKAADDRAATAKIAAEAKEAREAAARENKGGNSNINRTSAYVWDKQKENFTRVEGIEEMRKLGSIELGVEDDDVTTLNSDDGPVEKADGIALSTVSEEDVDTLVGDPAKIEDEISSEQDSDETPVSLYDDVADVAIGTTVEVDATVDTEAMEIAGKAAADLLKFENDEDLLMGLGIATKAALAKIPLYALANRVAKTVYQRAYYRGFVKKKGLRKKTLELVKKKNKAEENIKALKTMTKILSITAGRPTLALSEDLKNDVLKATDEVINRQGETLSVKSIESIFSVGDFRDNEALKLVKEVAFEKVGG